MRGKKAKLLRQAAKAQVEHPERKGYYWDRGTRLHAEGTWKAVQRELRQMPSLVL